MIPPNASDPYATDPGPRITSISPTVSGSRKEADGPARRSAVTRPSSIRISVRPLDNPRRAGTADCPSPVTPAPGMLSRTSGTRAGARCSRSPRPITVAAAAGGSSRSGTMPATTVTVSLAADSNRISSGPSAGTSRTVTGRNATPSGRITTSSKGSAGVGSSRNRPSASASAVPVWPTTTTRAPPRGCPSGPSSRPSSANAHPPSTSNIRTS